MKVFVSSTFDDLIPHREAVTKTLTRIKLPFSAMEYFGSRTGDSPTVCFQEIADCDLFVGIYAWRYGWQPHGSDISITEAEFNYAQELGKPCLLYIVNENHPWVPAMVDPPNSEAGLRLKAFKVKVNKQPRSTFTTPDNLASQIAADLTREISRLGNELNKLVGDISDWPEVSQVLDIVQLALIGKFKPLSALDFLQQIKVRLSGQSTERADLKARLYYLEGLANLYSLQTEQARDSFSTAYRFHQKREYLESWLLLLAKFPDTTQSTMLALTNELLALDPLSETGQAVRVSIQDEPITTSLASVPASVQALSGFRADLAEILETKGRLSDVQIVLAHDIHHHYSPSKLVFENYRYHYIVARAILAWAYDVEQRGKNPVYINEVTKLSPAVAARVTQAAETIELYIVFTRSAERIHKRVLHQAVFNLAVARYWLDGKLEAFDELRLNLDQLSNDQRHAYASDIAIALLQHNCADEALALLNSLDIAHPSAPPDLELLRSLASQRAGKFAEGLDLFRQHLLSCDLSDPRHFDSLMRYLLKDGDYLQDSEKLYEQLVQQGGLKEGLLRSLARVAVYAQNVQAKEIALESLHEALGYLTPDTEPSFRYAAAALCSALGEYKAALSLLEPIEGWPDHLVENAIIVRLRTRFLMGEDSFAVANELKAWREANGLNDDFCLWEVQIATLLPDWERVLEVSRAFLENQPSNQYFRAQKLQALFKKHKKEELLQELWAICSAPHLLARTKIPVAAQMAARSEEAELALQLLYPLAKEATQFSARTVYYFMINTFRALTERVYTLDVAGVDSYVYLEREEIGGRRVVVQLTSELLASDHPYAHQLLGTQTGYKLELEKQATGVIIHLVVVEILDRYGGLYREIAKQSETEDGTLPVESFTVDTSSFEAMNASFLEVVKPVEQERQRKVAEDIAKYAAGELPYSTLLRGVCRGEHLGTYHFATSTNGPGLQVVASPVFTSVHVPPVDLNSIENFALDWSTLPLIYELTNDGILQLSFKPYVSYFVIDQLDEELDNLRLRPVSELSLTVVGDELRPIFFSPEFHNSKVEALSDLKKWISENCQIRLVGEKLDVLRQWREKGPGSDDPEQEDFFKYVVDTTFLGHASGMIVVSDDTLMYQTLLQRGAVISSEIFLKYISGKHYDKTILPWLLSKNYRGVKVSADALYKAFADSGGRFIGVANWALSNFLSALKLEVEEWPQVTAFLKQLWVQSILSETQRQQVTTNFLASCMATMSAAGLKAVFIHRLAQDIREQFTLLPNQRDYILKTLRIIHERGNY